MGGAVKVCVDTAEGLAQGVAGGAATAKAGIARLVARQIKCGP